MKKTPTICKKEEEEEQVKCSARLNLKAHLFLPLPQQTGARTDPGVHVFLFSMCENFKHDVWM